MRNEKCFFVWPEMHAVESAQYLCIETDTGTVVPQRRVRDQERERDKLEKKKKRDEEMARVLQEQVGLRNQQREAARADRAAVAKQYRSDAEALVQAEAAAKRARAERKKAIQEDLDKQIALKVMPVHVRWHFFLSDAVCFALPC